MMVGEGGHEDVTWKNYYFCGALKNEIFAAETRPGFLKSLFETRPVMYLHRTNENGFIRNMWKTYSSIDPSYQISEEATLS